MNPATEEWRTETKLLENDRLEVTVKSATDDSKVVETITLVLVQGTPYTRFCDNSRWLTLTPHVRYRSSDIILASFPKCGTTWSEQCLLLLVNGGRPEVLNPQQKNCYDPSTGEFGKIWIETMVEQAPEAEVFMGMEGKRISWADFDNAPSPRIIKTHSPLRLLLGTNGQGLAALPEGCKVIVVGRNPLDACVSCYYHPKNSPAKRGWPFDAWAQTYLDGLMPNGSYFEWVKTWHEEAMRFPDRARWIQYEAMKKDPAQEVRDLAAFIGVSADENLVQAVVKYSSFESMKEQTEKQGGDTHEHLRNGKVGDWRSHFSEHMLGKFVARTKESLFNADELLAFAGLELEI